VSNRSRMRLVLPNVVTALRLVGVPVVLVLLIREARTPALAVYAAMVLTDVLDGWVARRVGGETRFGAYFDALTDMVVLLSLLGFLAWSGILPAWTPLLPAITASAFLVSSRRTGPRYDPIGKHYGAVLYVVTGVLLVIPKAAAMLGASILILVLTAASLVSRAICLSGSEEGA